MIVNIEKVSNGYIIKKYSEDEFNEDDTVMVALAFKDAVGILKDFFYGDKVNEVKDWDMRIKDKLDMTKD